MASPEHIVTEDVVTEDVVTEDVMTERSRTEDVVTERSRTEAAGDVTSPSPADGGESDLDSGSTRITTTDRNSVVLVGRLATAPDIRSFASGTSLARLLVTVRSNNHRPRTDVLPVTVWEPDGFIRNAGRGTRVSVEGAQPNAGSGVTEGLGGVAWKSWRPPSTWQSRATTNSRYAPASILDGKRATGESYRYRCGLSGGG